MGVPFKKTVLFCTLAAAAFITAGDAVAQTPYQIKPLKQLLENTDWISLPLPDNRMGPGAVVRVAGTGPNVDVRWLGNFKNCGLPSEAFQIVEGKFVPIGVGDNFSVDASLGASFLSKIGLGAEASKAAGGVLKIEKSGGDAVDLLALTIWLNKPGNLQTIPEACSRILAQDNVYLVTEAYEISEGSYDLFDKNGAKLTFDAPAGDNTVKGQVGFSLNSSGTLRISEKYYFAVRRVKQLSPGTFMTLGSSTQSPEADKLLREANKIE